MYNVREVRSNERRKKGDDDEVGLITERVKDGKWPRKKVEAEGVQVKIRAGRRGTLKESN